MTERFYSAEEAARILGLQVRTVRNYVRDGRLVGARIGKQYRIAASALEAFAGGEPSPRGEIDAAPMPPAPRVSVEASSVVQVDGLSEEVAERIMRTLTAATAGRSEEGAALRVEPLYDASRLRLRVIIVGSVADTLELIRMIELLASDAPNG